MSDGHCLNEYRTPACLNSLERMMMGWYDDFPVLSEAGPYELGSLSGHQLPWVLPADIDGEQFILEMRDGTGWDAYLPKGMVIYHLDASENRLYGYTRAVDVWTGNITAPINDYDAHPCFYAVPSLKYGRHSSGMDHSGLSDDAGRLRFFGQICQSPAPGPCAESCQCF